MTSRFDALGFDPAPGELGQVETSADQYQRVRDQLGFAHDAISDIVNQTGIWEGEASEAFARRVGDLPGYLDAAARSMSQAAIALTDWHAELSELQRRAWELELHARKARDEAAAARNDPAFGLANQVFTDPDRLQAANQELAAAQQRLDAALADVDGVLASAARLQQQHDDAAHRIADLLDKARELAPDDPGVLRRTLEAAGDAFMSAALTSGEAHMDAVRYVGDVIEDNANVIANASDVLGDVSTILSAAGDGFNHVPVAGQVIDQGLNMVSRPFGYAALAGHSVARLAGGEEVVPTETLLIDAAGVLTSRVPYAGSLSFGGQAVGEATTSGDMATIYDNLGQYWEPRDLRQGVEYTLGAAGPVAVAMENAVADGIDEDNATQADRDRERAEERVWE